VKKEDKERLVTELTERLKSTDTLLVADYRGLTMPQIDDLRSKLLEHGARFAVVKNTLTRRAAEAAGSDTLLALLEGPTAIAFLESDGDPVAVAKALSMQARRPACWSSAAGMLEGRPVEPGEIESLAKLPAFGHPPRPGAGRGDGSADRDRRAVHGAAAGPVRPDRRPHRAAAGAGRHVRNRRGRRPTAESQAEEATTESEAAPEEAPEETSEETTETQEEEQ
jgi:large subunit ribosomal protein L10